MKHATKRELKPKLRFPEFLDAGGWKTKRLGGLLLGHPDYGVNAPAVPYSEDLPAYLRITDISDEGYFLCDKKTSVAINVTDDNYLSEGDIVLARTGASVGKSYKFRKEDGKLVFAGFLIRIKPDPKKIDSTFLFNFTFTHQYWNWVGITSARSGQPGINGNEYATLPIPVPPHERALSEQQKIADCLSSMDELVAAQTQKLVVLNSHKKGLMQQLFPSEGETLPKLRFPEFQDAGEWEEKEVGEIFKVTRGEVLSMTLVKDVKTKETPYPVYSSQTKNNGLSGYYSSHLYEDAITWTTDGANAGDVNYRPGQFYCTNVCGVLINTDGYANPCVAALINSVSKNYVSYVGNPKLMNGVMSKIKIPLPSIEEQQKIADCLSSIDELIAGQSQKLATLKSHKKGLMQQLFPALDEVKR